ncbi:MAG: uracil-DNA glycosylase [Paludibacteraceae bacterium]|nr:uracil-DNA glycosylase [Paludibacteraceae bacterium]
MQVRIDESWRKMLQSEFDKPYFAQLVQFVKQEYATQQCFPPAKLIFNAFDSCPFEKVKVVIIGQDPYHDDGQAHGLSFSVPDGIAFPPSLRNIYQEISNEFGTPIPQSGNLTRWAEQGVLLLNSVLTVRAHQPASHQNRGWEELTDAAIYQLAKYRHNIVFLLWGSYAQRKAAYIDPNEHYVLQTAHPSPLSAYRGFFGCNHFKAANEYLAEHGIEPIQW